MKICIVGVGEVGTYYATHWSKAGHELVFTYFRNRARAESLVAKLGKHASLLSPHEAVAGSQVVLFCPRFEHMEDAARHIGNIGDAILIDPNNPFNPERTGRAAIDENQTAYRLSARLFPAARHVKAFHNLGIQTILHHDSHKLVAFVASDDAAAAQIVMQLAREAHLTPLFSGGFETAALSEYPGPLFGIPYTHLQDAQEALTQTLG